jgi:hypothetical protein
MHHKRRDFDIDEILPQGSKSEDMSTALESALLVVSANEILSRHVSGITGVRVT